MEPTKSQSWARNLSKNLESSYDSSALISHTVTSGENREHQIFDVFKYLLPQKYSMERNVVIINSLDEETIKFDGALVDVYNWPKLFADNHIIVSPIESVKIAFEVKSNLGLTEITKIFKEAKNIATASSQSPELSAKVVGFSYKCANIKLTFFDFVKAFLISDNYPLMIAVLNIGIICFIDKDGNVTKQPDKSSTPILLETVEDTLLVFIYFLTDQISTTDISATIRRYNQRFFSSMSYFKFEETFNTKIKSDSGEIRKHFEGNYDVNIHDTYENVKKTLGI